MRISGFEKMLPVKGELIPRYIIHMQSKLNHPRVTSLANPSSCVTSGVRDLARSVAVLKRQVSYNWRIVWRWAELPRRVA